VPPVRFLFDYVSPYAYLASTAIRSLAARHHRDVEPVPVLFAGLLQASGGIGPAEIPAKRDYLFKDVLRLARVLGVPVEPPASHPFNPLLALRATGCIDDPAIRWRFVDALYRAAWVDGRPMDSADTLADAARAAGVDADDLAARASSAEAKSGLREATDQAIAAGVFGVPTMLVDGELFWGVDSLSLLDRFLGGERAVDAARLEQWRRVVPSATRRVKP
jgi:2-hydroxychromene-2-carboxylate isomerase